MKKIFLWMPAVLGFLIIMTGCSPQASPTVAKNVSLSADFENIANYNWTMDIDNIPQDQVFVGTNGVWIFNVEPGRKMIKDAIQYELDARGYKKVDGNNADMLVTFYILEQPGSLRTTNGYITLASGEKVRTEDNVTYTDVKPGTLIINFIDGDTKKHIWQGFASGILKPDQINDQSKIRQAVSSIFSKFQYDNRNI